MTYTFKNRSLIFVLRKVLQYTGKCDGNSRCSSKLSKSNVSPVTFAIPRSHTRASRYSTVTNSDSSPGTCTNILQTLNQEPILSRATQTERKQLLSNYLTASDHETERVLFENMTIQENFLTEVEEQSLLDEIEPYMQRLHYEYDHWDDAIHGYRETERKHWQEQNKLILQRMRDVAFPAGSSLLPHVHILDIEKKGYIKAHVDAVRFCGNIIASLCLLSPCVMRLVNSENKEQYGDILLNRRSLYIMRDAARYDFTHEVLKESDSVFRNEVVPRDRRISVICRNQPDSEHMK